MNSVSLKYIIGLFSLLVSFRVFSQNKDFEYSWEPVTPHTLIPDSLMKEDAILIYHNRYVLNDMANHDYLYKERFHYKIKILTPKGLSENAVLRVSKNENAKFVGLDARTIKPNGKVIDLSADQIKRLDFKEGKDDDKITDLRFSIPNVEVGDEIEVLIDYESRLLPKGRDLLLQSHLVTLNAQIILKYNKDFMMDIITYNNMPKGQYEESSSHSTYKWDLKNIPSVSNQNFISPKFELPYVSYMVRVKGNNETNNRLYKTYFANFYDKNYATGNFLSTIKRKASVSDTQSTFSQFATIYQYICSQYTLVDALPLEDQEKQLDYLLDKKQLDHHRLHVLLRHLFDELHLKYYLCIGRNKYSGFLDFNFIPPQAVTDFFFSIKDGSGNAHIVYPGYETYFKIDEMPPALRGTESLFIGKPNMEGAFVDVLEQEIASLSSDYNYHIRNARIVMHENDDSLKYKVKEIISGDLSTLYKIKAQSTLDEERPKTIDKTSENSFPFTTTLRYSEESVNCMQPVGPHTYAIKLGEIISVKLSEVNPGKRTLNYFPTCAYKDINKIMISFDKEINSDNSAKLNQELTNEYASFRLSIKKVDPKTITLEVEYEIKSLFIEASQIGLLRTINNSLSEAINSNLIIVFNN
jgi:hypothetical protein